MTSTESTIVAGTAPLDADHATRTAAVRAAWANQRQWVLHAARTAASSGARSTDPWRENDLAAARTGATGAMLLPDEADVEPDALDRALTWLRGTGCGEVLIWSGEAAPQADRWLSARGARESFRPHWMTLPLDRPLPAPPATVETRLATTHDIATLERATELPYVSPWQVRVSRDAIDDGDDVRLLIALDRASIVGRAIIHLADGPLGRVAGLYDVGVHPAHERRGIGRQLTHAALVAARDARAIHATLNATPAGEGLYRRMGFTNVGEGRTWLLPEPELHRPPSPETVRFALAISGGEPIEPAWNHLARSVLPNRDTPLGHAARFGQRDTARSLLALGTLPDIVALWALGMHDEAHDLMGDPGALAQRLGANDATALHLAIACHDAPLLDALLAAGADPRLRDGTWYSDASGWARAVGNDAALHRLNQHTAARRSR